MKQLDACENSEIKTHSLLQVKTASSDKPKVLDQDIKMYSGPPKYFRFTTGVCHYVLICETTDFFFHMTASVRCTGPYIQADGNLYRQLLNSFTLTSDGSLRVSIRTRDELEIEGRFLEIRF